MQNVFASGTIDDGVVGGSRCVQFALHDGTVRIVGTFGYRPWVYFDVSALFGGEDAAYKALEELRNADGHPRVRELCRVQKGV